MVRLAVTLALALLCGVLASTAHAGDCVPFQLPDGYSSFQEYCKYLQTIDGDSVDQDYLNAADPVAGDVFPLHGATLGCIAGSSGAATANRLGMGRWNGKDFKEWDPSSQSARVWNIVDNDVNVGSSIVNQGNWAQGLNVQDQFPGSIAVGQAWSDRSRQAWILNYDPNQSGAGILNGLIANTRDEIRQVGPGVMIGKTYAKPFTSANPLPVPVSEGADFYLFQVCDSAGNYPSGPMDRVLS